MVKKDKQCFQIEPGFFLSLRHYVLVHLRVGVGICRAEGRVQVRGKAEVHVDCVVPMFFSEMFPSSRQDLKNPHKQPLRKFSQHFLPWENRSQHEFVFGPCFSNAKISKTTPTISTTTRHGGGFARNAPR